MPVKRMPQQSSFNDIHQFWFGEHDGLTPPADKADMWFGNGRAYDDTIRARFGALPDFAAAGSFDSWRDEPRSSLALILVLDQFPRHVHRNSARAFAYDAKAREVCLSGIATGHDVALTPLERSFYYMPLEHAEDRALQERSVALFQSLRDTAGEDVREAYENTLHYAVAHRDIVVRFGRFPHRNELLDRETTAEEADFLSQPDSSFL